MVAKEILIVSRCDMGHHEVNGGDEDGNNPIWRLLGRSRKGKGQRANVRDSLGFDVEIGLKPLIIASEI